MHSLEYSKIEKVESGGKKKKGIAAPLNRTNSAWDAFKEFRKFQYTKYS